MRRNIVILIAAALLIQAMFISLSFAQAVCRKMGKDMVESNMRGKEEMMEKCPMHGMMMKEVMEESIIATTDSGAIVLTGNKLIKYDKDLNLVKEVEIKVDIETMQNNMMKMMNNCPMMKGVMVEAGMAGNNTVQKIPLAQVEAKSEQKK